MSNTKKKPQSFLEYKALQARLSLAPISLPESLNDYFADVIPHMGNVLSFMRKYIGQDEHIKKIIETYDCLPPHHRRNLSKVDLDYLAEKAGVEKIIVRERILVALSRYAESKFKLTITIYSEQLIREIVAVALDSAHPDSQRNKELLAEYLGIKAIPKSAQINITNTHNQVNNEQNLELELNQLNQLSIGADGLPSMHDQLGPIERLVKAASERKMIEDGQEQQEQFIDLDEVEQIDKQSLHEVELVAGEDYLEDESEDEEDE